MSQGKLGLGLLSALLWASACSGGPPSVVEADRSDQVLSPQDIGPEETVARVQRARADSLSNEEEVSIRDYMAARGFGSEQIAFDGRMMKQEGDMLSFADDVLDAIEQAGVLEKGRAFSAINNTNAFAPAVCTPGLFNCPIEPVDLADPSGSNLLWRRPDTTRPYFLLVPNGAPSYLGTLLSLAAARLTGVQASSSDCLDPSLFQVISQAAFFQLPKAARDSSYVITFLIGEFSQVCGGGAAACSIGPSNRSVTINGQSQQRLSFGGMIGLPNTPSPAGEPDGIADDASNESVGMVVHELMHAMGIAHVNAPDSLSSAVPGTQQNGGNQTQSIMVPDAAASNPNWRDWSSSAQIPALDKLVLSKLYGGNCAYDSGFRTVTP